MERIIYTIHQNNKLFTVSSIANPIIFSSFDKQKISNVIEVLKTHKKNTNRWLNSTRMVTNNAIYLTENEKIFNSNEIEIAFFDLNNQEDLICIANIYHVHNTKIFLVKDVVYDAETPLLSVQGIIVEDVPIQLDTSNIDINLRLYFEEIIKKE